MPTNWKHPWTRVGKVWYTFLLGPGTWHQMEKECRQVEPGRTTLASIKSVAEQKHLENMYKLNKGNIWMAGVRVASKTFYWYKNLGGSIKLEPLTIQHWDKDQPDDYEHGRLCY